MSHLVTFAIPYMNGPLHMGHFYSLMKAELSSRYYELSTGEKSLFPFGFHCTGMPIYAAAQRLSRGDTKVAHILKMSGIPEDAIELFKDPQYWIRYFPKSAITTLKGLNLNIDLTRSFVTTEINPVYNSFVRWQYYQLKPRMKYENRYCIYSLKDKQPCADHDRETGEGVKPVPYNLYIRDGMFRTTPTRVPDKTERIMVKLTETNTYIGKMPISWYQNAIAQNIAVTILTAEECNDLQVTNDATLQTVIYMPAQQVISRSGDECITALTPQWYLNYSDPQWKKDTLECLSHMTIHDNEVRKQLEISISNMQDWCVSREYGLGTRLPWDDRYLIDSLSDSTIYMAYYTVCHLLHTDPFGADRSCSVGSGNPDKDLPFWDYVFHGITPVTPFDEKLNAIAEQARAEFLQRYPFSLRVSGKDLIYNHLTMLIYHHSAVWGPEMIPGEYLVNGYVKIDGNKMSKSAGNFITVDELSKNYNINAIKLILSEAGDGLNDANIKLHNYNATLQALEDFNQNMTRYEYTLKLHGHNIKHLCRLHASHDHFIHRLIACLRQADQSYRCGRFREALTEGWRKVVKYRSAYYRTIQRIDINLMLAYQLVEKYVMHPVLPHYHVTNDERRIIGGLLALTPDEDILKARDYYEEIVKCDSHVIIVPELVRTSPLWNYIQKWLNSDLRAPQIFLDNTELHPSRDPFKIKPKAQFCG